MFEHGKEFDTVLLSIIHKVQGRGSAWTEDLSSLRKSTIMAT